ncbi:HAD family hydrolase [Agromyces sp. NPDC057679]|uniref:HAD family hydrolase n=1 Tax=Agromyces sp. NPDC057679 TaxID=3346207 RepID=UPI00366A7B27
MRPAFFADLDGTTIFSARQVGLEERGFTGTTVVETFRGEPASFMSFSAVTTLKRIADRCEFVPTTTRDFVQYARVGIPGITPRFAIVANGGQIIVDGVQDEAWTEQVNARIADLMSPAEVFDRVSRFAHDASWLRTVKLAAGLFVYVVPNSGATPPPEFIDCVRSFAAEAGYQVSVQGRGKVYLIPNGVTKEAAANEVATRVGSTFTIAAGDSATDIGMMRWADHAIRPAHGELQHVPGLSIPVTVRSGILAGEDILTQVERHIAYPGRPPRM